MGTGPGEDTNGYNFMVHGVGGQAFKIKNFKTIAGPAMSKVLLVLAQPEDSRWDPNSFLGCQSRESGSLGCTSVGMEQGWRTLSEFEWVRAVTDYTLGQPMSSHGRTSATSPSADPGCTRPVVAGLEAASE